MADFAVSTKFTAQDRVSKTFKKMGRGADKFGDRASKAFRKASRSGSRFGDIVKGVFAANILSRGIAGITRGLSEATQQFITLDDAIFSAAAKFKDINVLTTEGKMRMQALRDSAREVGGVVEFTATQAAQGLDFLALAGKTSEEAMKLLPPITDLATVAQIDLARATDIATDALGAFGLETKDSIQLTKNFGRVNDVLAVTMASTNTNIEDMFEAIKTGAPPFVKAGQTVESFSTLLGIMANAGIKGAKSGTVLRNMMTRLADPAREAQKAIRRLKFEVGDVDGNFRDIVDILADVKKGLIGIGSVERTKLLSQIFGERGISGVNVLLDAGADSIRALRNELINAGGASKEMAVFMRGSLGNLIKAFSSAALEKAFQIFDKFSEKGRGGIIAFTERIRQFDTTGIIKFLKLTGAGFKDLWQIVGPIVTTVLPPLVLLLMRVTKTLAVFSPVLTPMIVAMGAMALGLKAWAAAQAILNIVMSANPIGLIIIGIAALVGGIVWAMNNTEKLGAIWDVVWSGMKMSFFTVISFIFKWYSSVIKLILKGARFAGNALGFDTSLIDNALKGIDEMEKRLDKGSFFDEDAVSNLKIKAVTTTANVFSGRLDIAGAPAGSTVTDTTTGGSPLDVNVLGVNP